MTMENQELFESALAQIIEDATTVREFVIDQTPSIITEVLEYNTAAIWIRAVLALGICCLLPKFTNLTKRAYQNDDGVTFIWGSLAGATGVAGPIMFYTELFEALKITLAPRLWLIEYAAELLS